MIAGVGFATVDRDFDAAVLVEEGERDSTALAAVLARLEEAGPSRPVRRSLPPLSGLLVGRALFHINLDEPWRSCNLSSPIALASSVPGASARSQIHPASKTTHLSSPLHVSRILRPALQEESF